jgi:hypothetical protein
MSLNTISFLGKFTTGVTELEISCKVKDIIKTINNLVKCDNYIKLLKLKQNKRQFFKMFKIIKYKS